MVERFRFRREQTPLVDDVCHVPPMAVPSRPTSRHRNPLVLYARGCSSVNNFSFFFFRIFIGRTSARLAIFGLKVGLVVIDFYYYYYYY
jgi:hypothetical protein